MPDLNSIPIYPGHDIGEFSPAELTSEWLASVLGKLPNLAIAVVGDFFLDNYLVIDRTLSEVSIETGLEAYQVVSKRPAPGAAGTVTSNLRALGVGRVYAVGLTGDDGEGYELRQGLASRGVVLDYLVTSPEVFTPTYTKPMLREPGKLERELERLDLKNRRPVPPTIEARLVDQLRACVGQVAGVIVADQVQEANHGVVSDRLRAELARLAEANPSIIFAVDSRTRIGKFRSQILKPNRAEAAAALGLCETEISIARAAELGLALARTADRPAFITLSEQGSLVCDPGSWPDAKRPQAGTVTRVHGVPIAGPTDPVGAGDSTMSGIVAALCAGASLVEAAAFGNLVASITVQKLGTTGTASPTELMRALAELR